MTDRLPATSELMKHIHDLQAVLEVSRELMASTDLHQLLSAVERAAVAVLECESASIMLYDADHDLLVPPIGSAPSSCLMAEDVARQTVETGQAVHLRHTGPVAADEDAVNVSTFPLYGQDGSIVGVLEARNPDPFDPWDLELVQMFDAHVGVALQRQLLLDESAEKRRIERDLKLARSIQQQLLPATSPRVAGFDIAGWNRPADDTGGDFWDHLPLGDDGALAMAVADATGHGIGPALVMASCRALLRATLTLSEDLREVVERVNRLLCADLPANRSVTAFVARLDPSASVLHYLSAGQGPMLHYVAATDRIEPLNANAVPLGFFPEVSWPAPAQLSLEPGDMMVVVTDGFFEWESRSGEEYGIHRVAAMVSRHRNEPAAALIEALYADVRRFVGDEVQSDDLTALVIKRQ